MKNLTSGENNFSDVHEELAYIDFPPVSGKTILPQIFLKQLLQRLYSVHALRPRAAYFFSSVIFSLSRCERDGKFRKFSLLS